MSISKLRDQLDHMENQNRQGDNRRTFLGAIFAAIGLGPLLFRRPEPDEFAKVDEFVKAVERRDIEGSLLVRAVGDEWVTLIWHNGSWEKLTSTPIRSRI